MKAKLFQLIDLDRTLFDTSAFVKAITDEIDETEPGLGTTLDAQFELAYEREETFFALRYLREHLGDEAFETLIAKVVAIHGRDAFKLAGFEERLALADQLTDLRPSYGILTFGDAVDQRMKLAIVGLQDAPVYLTTSADKSPVIASWQQADGTFTLPTEYGNGIAEKMTFEDDKLRAFNGLPEGVDGIWIHGPGVDVQEGSAAVHRVDSLEASSAYLAQTYL